MCDYVDTEREREFIHRLHLFLKINMNHFIDLRYFILIKGKQKNKKKQMKQLKYQETENVNCLYTVQILYDA